MTDQIIRIWNILPKVGDEGVRVHPQHRVHRCFPTTPISTSSRPPNEYDEVMGITQVDSREAERFEEGIEPEFQDVEEEYQSV